MHPHSAEDAHAGMAAWRRRMGCVSPSPRQALSQLMYVTLAVMVIVELEPHGAGITPRAEAVTHTAQDGVHALVRVHIHTG